MADLVENVETMRAAPQISAAPAVVSTAVSAKDAFSVANGLCNQNGRIGFEKSGFDKVAEQILVDELSGSTDLKAAAAGQKLPACSNPAYVSNTVKYNPKR